MCFKESLVHSDPVVEIPLAMSVTHVLQYRSSAERRDAPYSEELNE